jgi:hypothetical protein
MSTWNPKKVNEYWKETMNSIRGMMLKSGNLKARQMME